MKVEVMKRPPSEIVGPTKTHRTAKTQNTHNARRVDAKVVYIIIHKYGNKKSVLIASGYNHRDRAVYGLEDHAIWCKKRDNHAMQHLNASRNIKALLFFPKLRRLTSFFMWKSF